MKRYQQIILTATAASFLAFPVMAKEDSTQKTNQSSYTRARAPYPDSDRIQSAAKASDIIGMSVKNYQNEELGSVDDLAVDLESGRIVQVIISTGGFIGIGDRLSAVAPGALQYDSANQVLNLDANKEQLKRAPEFFHEKWTDYSDYDHLSSVYAYYGQEHSFKFINREDPANNSAHTTKTRDVDGTWIKVSTTGENQWMIPSSRLSQIQRASVLMGLNVKNRQDETLGHVDNMLVDVQSGRIVAIMISSGGFLGIGDELSAVPPTALSFNSERDTLQLDTTKDMLSAAPHFKSSEWPDFNQPAFYYSVYNAYKVEPYFKTDSAPAADNTAIKFRERDDRNLTPLDQGNSKADTDITAQIRKGILVTKGMSMNAKNVKIITNNGQVTLRGPVKNEEEKRIIGEIANGIARSENVHNQLEITITTASN